MNFVLGTIWYSFGISFGFKQIMAVWQGQSWQTSVSDQGGSCFPTKTWRKIKSMAKRIFSISIIFYHSASAERLELPDLHVFKAALKDLDKHVKSTISSCDISPSWTWLKREGRLLKTTCSGQSASFTHKTCRGRWLILHDFAAGLSIQHSNLHHHNLV